MKIEFKLDLEYSEIVKHKKYYKKLSDNLIGSVYRRKYIGYHYGVTDTSLDFDCVLEDLGSNVRIDIPNVSIESQKLNYYKNMIDNQDRVVVENPEKKFRETKEKITEIKKHYDLECPKLKKLGLIGYIEIYVFSDEKEFYGTNSSGGGININLYRPYEGYNIESYIDLDPIKNAFDIFKDFENDNIEWMFELSRNKIRNILYLYDIVPVKRKIMTEEEYYKNR